MLTVTTPATQRNLTTVSAVKLELGIADSDATYDPWLLQMITQATAAMERHCGGRVFARQSYLETAKGYGDVSLVLKRRPIVSVASVLFDSSPITDYTIEDPEAGILFRSRGWSWTAGSAGWGDGVPVAGSEEPRFTVAYTAGYILPPDPAATIPADLQRLCGQAVKAWYMAQKDSPAQELISKNVDDLALTFAQRDYAPSDLPTPVIAGLTNYRDL